MLLRDSHEGERARGQVTQSTETLFSGQGGISNNKTGGPIILIVEVTESIDDLYYSLFTHAYVKGLS